MKNRILHYIFKNPIFTSFDGNFIYIDFDVCPISAVILRGLIEKHFNILYYITFDCTGCFRIQL